VTRTRWHDLRDAIVDSNLPASDKAVYRYLLDKANYTTAELSAEHTPTRKVIARKTSLSYAQVGYSTGHLRRHGWLDAKGATGPGHPLEYRLALGVPCDCSGRVHAPQRRQSERSNAASGWQRTVPVVGSERCQPTVPTSQVRTQVHTRDKRAPREEVEIHDQLPPLGAAVWCPFCGADGIVGERLIEHDDACWRGAMHALYDQEAGA
jgi:hypothetical protein